ncbi:hypothetical protein [Parvibacter caecicola]|uniref:hypothetical protein n=1 Tax=Parvibacter caecicola TaxID=747645 RepID=UPI0027320988|nr:hypothetical protein [Parvibacter caecicola]
MMRKIILGLAGMGLALCAFGCTGAPAGTEVLQVGSASLDYPATWVQSDMTQGALLGVEGSSAKVVSPQNGSGGFVAVSDLSKSGMTIGDYQRTLQGSFVGTVSETTVDGHEGLKLSQNADGFDYTAYLVAGEDGETLAAAMVAEIPDGASPEVESQFNGIVDSFNMK